MPEQTHDAETRPARTHLTRAYPALPPDHDLTHSELQIRERLQKLFPTIEAVAAALLTRPGGALPSDAADL